MFDIAQFRESIVAPALSVLQMYSKEAEELMVFTCAAESKGGTYLKQIKGPALGIYQMEPNTHTDIWQNFIMRDNRINAILAMNFDVRSIPQIDRLVYDLRYATAMTRLHYRRIKEPLPPHDKPELIWAYYKKYYNTPLGKAQKEECIAAYKKFCGQAK